MAKLEITAHSKTFSVKMGDYMGTEAQVVDAANTGKVTETQEGSWYKSNISFHRRPTYIQVEIEHERPWKISNVEDLANGILQVSKIGDLPPVDLDDLTSWLITNHGT